MLWERDLMSWERDKYFFHMSPQCCRNFLMILEKSYLSLKLIDFLFLPGNLVKEGYHFSFTIIGELPGTACIFYH